jgi:RNA recognition motif-containing protein
MTNKVLVEHLPFNFNSLALSAWASEVAPVKESKIIVDALTGRSTGQGVVTYESVLEAAQAVQELGVKPAGGATVTLTHIPSGHAHA